MNNEKLKPFFCYFGGKHRTSKLYPPPSQDTIIEPFAGSAAYSHRYYTHKIELFDSDPIIYGLWQYLIRVSELEILSLPIEIEDVRDLLIPQEAKWLIGFWINKGSTRPANKASTWFKSKLRPNSYWGNVIKLRIASQLKFIRHWKVYNQSYDQISNRIATWFIDPPYHSSGKEYKFNKIDYNHLGQWCVERYGQTIVCEQFGAQWLNFKEFKKTKALCNKKSREVIWTQ